MKKLLTATALTTLLGTAAFAQTDAEQAQINQYLPGTDIATLTEAEITSLVAIANGGDSDTEKRAQMQAVVEGSNTITTTTVTAVNVTQLQQYAPNTDFTTWSAEDLANAQVIANSGLSDTEVRARLQNYDSGRTMVSADMISQEEMLLINRYLPTVDLSTLTEDQVQEMVGIVNSDEDFKQRKLMEVING